MEVVRMNESHVDQIAALEKLCFSAPWSRTSISSELSNPLSLWLVAAESGVVAGYVGSQSVLGEADMMNLAVAPAFRRHGIGRMLVVALLEALRANHVSSLSLEVRASNAPAQALYAELGFARVGVRPRYYDSPCEDAWILKKEWEL